MAEDADAEKDVEVLKIEKAKFDAEKAKFEAEKARHEAETALNRAKAVAEVETQTKLAEAEKKRVEAENQAFLAKTIGTTTAGPHQGTVTAKGDIGKTEAGLLAAHAMKEAAGKIAAAVKCSVDGTKPVSVFNAKNFPDFQSLRSFRFRIALIDSRFKAAGIRGLAKPALEAAALETAPIAATASAGLEALSNILDYFKTDHTVGGVEVSLDDAMLGFSVAGAIKKAGRGAVLPLAYGCNPQADVVAAVNKEFEPLEDMRRYASAQAEGAKEEIEALKADPDANAAAIASHEAILAKLTDAIKSYDEFLAALIKTAAEGTSQISVVINELAVETACGSGPILLLRLEDSGGGYLIKRNLWTALGSMPLWHMGGVSVSYLLLDGANGQVLDGNVVTVHGGFVKAGALRRTLNH